MRVYPFLHGYLRIYPDEIRIGFGGRHNFAPSIRNDNR